VFLLERKMIFFKDTFRKTFCCYIHLPYRMISCLQTG
jgi:hypothetical protein